MDEATKAALNAFLRQAVETAQAGAEWTAGQAPLLVQEWLRWQLVEAAVGTTVGVVLAYGLSLILRSAFRAMAKDGEVDPGHIIGGIFCAAMAIPLLCVNVMTLVKVLVAPRVMVLEQVREWIR